MASTKLHEALTVPSAQELPAKSGVLIERMCQSTAPPALLAPEPPHPQSQQTAASTKVPGINRNQLRESSLLLSRAPLPGALAPSPTPCTSTSQNPNLFPFPGPLPSPCKSAHTSPSTTRSTRSCLKPTAPPRCPLSLSFYPSLPQRVLFKSLFISGSNTVSPQPPTFHGNVSPRSSLTLLLNRI